MLIKSGNNIDKIKSIGPKSIKYCFRTYMLPKKILLSYFRFVYLLLYIQIKKHKKAIPVHIWYWNRSTRDRPLSRITWYYWTGRDCVSRVAHNVYVPLFIKQVYIFFRAWWNFAWPTNQDKVYCTHDISKYHSYGFCIVDSCIKLFRNILQHFTLII